MTLRLLFLYGFSALLVLEGCGGGGGDAPQKEGGGEQPVGPGYYCHVDPEKKSHYNGCPECTNNKFICCDGAQTKATVKYESNWRCTETMGMIDNCECAKAGLKVPEKCGADAQKEVEATCGSASAGTTAAP